jgi:hypothetical protein
MLDNLTVCWKLSISAGVTIVLLGALVLLSVTELR